MKLQENLYGNMILSSNDINHFFRIINLNKEIKIGKLDFLNLIIVKMTESIPWHNLNMIFDGLGTIPSSKKLKERMLNGEGGICLETNRFMLFFLRELGYDVRYILCGREQEEKKHIALLVTINAESFFVDFGDAQVYNEALSLTKSKVLIKKNISYQLKKVNDCYKILKKKNEIWSTLYEFRLDVVTDSDFKELMRKHYSDFSFSPLWRKVHFAYYPNQKLRALKGLNILTENNNFEIIEKKFDNIDELSVNVNHYFSSSIISKYKFVKAFYELEKIRANQFL